MPNEEYLLSGLTEKQKSLKKANYHPWVSRWIQCTYSRYKLPLIDFFVVGNTLMTFNSQSKYSKANSFLGAALAMRNEFEGLALREGGFLTFNLPTKGKDETHQGDIQIHGNHTQGKFLG